MNRIIFLIILFSFQIKVIGQSNDFGLNIIGLYNSEFNNKNLIDISDFNDDLSKRIELSINHRINFKNGTYFTYELNYGISETQTYSIDDMAVLEIKGYQKSLKYGLNLLIGKPIKAYNKAKFNIAGLVGYSIYPKYNSTISQTAIKNENPDIIHKYVKSNNFPTKQMFKLGFRLNFQYNLYQNFFLNFSLDNFFNYHIEKGIKQSSYKRYTIDNSLFNELVVKTEINRSLISVKYIGFAEKLHKDLLI